MKTVGFMGENGSFVALVGALQFDGKEIIIKQTERMSPKRQAEDSDGRRKCKISGEKTVGKKPHYADGNSDIGISNPDHQHFFLCQGLYFGSADSAGLCSPDVSLGGAFPYGSGAAGHAAG